MKINLIIPLIAALLVSGCASVDMAPNEGASAQGNTAALPPAGGPPAASCEKNFRSEGSPDTGIRFETAVRFAKLDARKAISQLKTASVLEGFDIGAENYSRNTGTLTVTQRASQKARAFDSVFRADGDAGSIFLTVSLPKGMSAKPEDMRKEMCLIISSVDMARAENTAPGSSSRVAAYWTKATKTGTAELCGLNFQKNDDYTNGDAFSTWIPVNGLEPAAARERIQLLAKEGNFKVIDALQHGASTEMLLYIGQLGPLSNVPLRLTLDGDLGVAAITAHLAPRKPPPTMVEVLVSAPREPETISDEAASGVMCIILAAASNTDGPSTKPKRTTGSFFNIFKSQATLKREALTAQLAGLMAQLEGPDALFQKAVESGKAIVIMPVTGLVKRYGDVRVGTPQHWAWQAENTAVVQWRGTRTGAELRSGPNVYASNTGLRGSWFNIPGGGFKEYALYIVEPDTYTIAGTSYMAATDAMPQLSDAQSNGRSRLGQILLKPVKNTDFLKDGYYWQNAEYTSRREDYCAAMVVSGPGTGGCASWGSTTVHDMTSPGGWRESISARQIDGLQISTQLKKEAASFTVKAGEAIVVDGFAVVPAGAEFNRQACVMKDEGPQCDLQTLQLLRIPANASEVNTIAPAYADSMPQISRLLQAAIYRPSTVKAQKGAFDGKFGQRYAIGEK